MTKHGRDVDDLLLLRRDLSQVATARDFVRQRCHDLAIDPDACDAAVLLTSEAVTNAFIHGRSDARVRVSSSEAGLRVEVGDDNSRHPEVLNDDPDALDGRGLAILAMVADQWGVRDDPYGKTVWFEVRC